ncbi:MAG: DUF1800 domain-containing protein [Verrucomicrobiaceae bacterium]|nr:DUF1800 domain-containing protein [Verrucomicrobiaceae bacterium]
MSRFLLSYFVLVACCVSLQAQQALPQVKLILMDGEMQEDWPDLGMVAVRRDAAGPPLSVKFTLTGTALVTQDYTTSNTTDILIPDGEKEAWVTFGAVTDALKEPTEKIIVTLLPDAAYTVASLIQEKSVTLTIADDVGLPGAKEAARFLTQAAFGPNADSTADTDIIPQNVQTVMSMGFSKWIDDQFKKPVGTIQPYLDYMRRSKREVYSHHKVESWWRRVMGVGTAYPGAPVLPADPLRQRIGFALSEIFVISDGLDELSVYPTGMANYYDMLLKGSFGNFRTLLFNVSMHPCMGVYLSHMMNRKADPDYGTFPDENYAREVMQLFTIGLWELNPDGTRRLDGNNQPIPTYDNGDITEFAKVFTGLSFGDPKAQDFWSARSYFTAPMKPWDEEHDLGAKTLLNGVTLPARVASDPDKGTATMADVNAAIDCLFNHPNTGPFICKQLIQRLITSNPSPAYVQRVSSAFANNGSGVRGDMKAVIRAILLDDEARNPAMLFSTSFGRLKEPYLRTVNLARAFNARSSSGQFRLSGLQELLFQQPLSAPSVFNFFRPGYSPAGPVSDAGMVAPEFQILNAISAISIPNYFYRMPRDGFSRWGQGNSANEVRANLAVEFSLYNDIPALLRRLDMVMTGGTLPPEQHQLIREAVEAIDDDMWDWKKERIYLAFYLIAASPEAAVHH